MTELRGGEAIPLLLDYLFWARDRVLATAAELPAAALRETPSLHGRGLRATLVHELDVEMGWRARLRGEQESAWGTEAEIKPDDFPTLGDLMARWRAEEAQTRAWIAGLSPSELEAPVTVNRLEGYPLAVYVLHLLAHGLMELSSASAILNELGRPVGDIGLLDALDDLAPLPRLGAAAAAGTAADTEAGP